VSQAEAETAGVKSSSSSQGRAELSQMSAIVAPPPSCEELGIGGMGRLRPEAGLEEY
jgi:hypothetical protein